MEISNADISNSFSFVITAIVGWVAKFFSSKITKLDEKQIEIELTLARDFVKKTDLKDMQDSIDEMKTMLTRGTTEIVEIKNSQNKIENRLENLCVCLNRQSTP